MIGSWSGTSEIDAFTKQERLLLFSGQGPTGLLLRCMGGKLSIGWLDVSPSAYKPGETGSLTLRVNDDLIGPFDVSAVNKSLVIGELSTADLTRIAKATSDIGFRIMVDGRGSTGGVKGSRSADVAKRLQKACPD